MRQLFDRRTYLSFDDGKTWEDTSIWFHWHYIDTALTDTVEDRFDTYDQVASFVRARLVPNANMDTTIFGRECLAFSTVDRGMQKRMTRRRFRPIRMKTVYEKLEFANGPSVERLARMLTVEELINYLYDRGFRPEVTK